MNPLIESKLREMLDVAREYGLAEMLWQEEGVRISFRRGHAKTAKANAQPSEAASAAPVVEPEEFVKSPIVGIFHRALSKGHPPLVMEGNHIKPGDRIGVVECMKIPTDVVSYCAGEIKKILVEDGQAVEYGQPLFSIVPQDLANGKSRDAVNEN